MQKCPHRLRAPAALNGDEREINSSSNKTMQTSNLRNPHNNYDHLGLMYGDAQHKIQY